MVRLLASSERSFNSLSTMSGEQRNILAPLPNPGPYDPPPVTPNNTYSSLPALQSDSRSSSVASEVAVGPRSSPRPSRIPEVNTIDDVFRYWETGAPEKGLLFPLRIWRDIYDRADYESEAQKWSNIRIVYDEFTKHCEGDWDVFERQYPGLHCKYTKLLLAIRKARVARGDAKPRHRCKH
jgi:hypothetical protein